MIVGASLHECMCFSRMRPLPSNVMPSSSRSRCFLSTSGAPLFLVPEKPPIVLSELTTLCQGISCLSYGFLLHRCPTALAAFGLPSAFATSPYVVTRPFGTPRTRSYTFSVNVFIATRSFYVVHAADEIIHLLRKCLHRNAQFLRCSCATYNARYEHSCILLNSYLKM